MSVSFQATIRIEPDWNVKNKTGGLTTLDNHIRIEPDWNVKE